MSERPKRKRRQATALAASTHARVSNAHYVGYVEDNESVEAIMKKFEELERIQQEFTSSPQLVSNTPPAKPEQDGCVQDTLIEDPLTQEQLEEVFRRTSAFTVKSASLDPNFVVDMDALDLLQAEYRNNDTNEFVEEDDYYYVGDDFDLNEQVDDKDGQYRDRDYRRSTPSKKKRLDRQSVLNKHKILAAQAKDETGRIVTAKKQVCSIDPSLPTYVKIPPRPIKASWAHFIKPLSEIIPPTHYTYHEVKNLVDQDLTQYGSQFQAIYMDPPLLMAGEAPTPGKINIDDLAKLNVPDVIETGFLFIWSEKEWLHRIVKIATQWGFRYVENYCWVKKNINNTIYKGESNYFCKSKLNLLIFKKEKSKIEIRHQRNADCLFDFVKPMVAGQFTEPKPSYVYHVIETLLPKSVQESRLLKLWSTRNYRRLGWTTVAEVTKDNVGAFEPPPFNPNTGADSHPPPPPPPPPPAQPNIGISPIAEAKLAEHVGINPQPLDEPDTHYPDTHAKSSQDLDTIAPTADKTTYRLAPEGLKYAQSGDLWQFGVINTKPDVFIVSNTNYPDVNNHYHREFRIYTLMKWILRVHRRDPERTAPLVMVDAGSNHGLFSLVAGASGAHTIAFEPQTHLRSVINMAGRLNQLSQRLRVLPFAVLDQFKKLAMEKVEINDGGIGGLSYDNPNALITTQTIRLDTLPAYNRLFPQSTAMEKQLKINTDRKDDKSILEPEDLGAEYAKEIEAASDNASAEIPESLLFRQPIHFLKIDVEGFELPALRSAAKLFENQLVENTVLEFGPPSRWDVTVPDANHMDLKDVRAKTMKEAKEVLHRAVDEWGLDINLLPAEGWEKTVKFMIDHGIDLSGGNPSKNKVVQRVNAWKFDDLPLDHDEFEKELEIKENVVTEFIRLPARLIDDYLEASQAIGEMYLWFTKKDTQSPVLQKIT
ncbi:MT-A70 protein [Mucor ambiguus]|uniref:MT-A70 protein n=1 Tax=Mucor ambiguus TaxID=91626 RepID=A0A0C9MGT6_9FUNG|nr:MT-A70 protein [Mucor ambiguus]